MARPRQRKKIRARLLRKPLLEFKAFICPRASPQYVVVRVHLTQPDLARYRGRVSHDKTTEAYFRPASLTSIFRVDARGRETQEVNTCLGDLNFHLNALVPSIIAHECFHAITVWSAREGCRPLEESDPGRPDNEELCAEALLSLVAQITVAAATLWQGTRATFRQIAQRERAYYQ